MMAQAVRRVGEDGRTRLYARAEDGILRLLAVLEDPQEMFRAVVGPAYRLVPNSASIRRARLVMPVSGRP